MTNTTPHMQVNRRVVFDSNVYLSVFFGTTPQAKRYRRRLVDLFDEVRCAVVLHEIIRGSTRPKKRGRALSRMATYEACGDNLIVAPTNQDWKRAGLALQELNDLDIISKRKMCNDALIASLCISHEATLISNDSDYRKLMGTRALASLKFIYWDHLRERLLT